MILIRRSLTVWPIIVGLASVYGAIVWQRGPITHEDAQQYHGWALALIDRRYDFGAFLRDIQWSGGDLHLYLSWIVIVAGAVEVFGSSWQYAIVGLNVICYILSAWLLLKLVGRIDDLNDVMFVVAAFLIVLWDYLYWMTHVLADSSMCLISLFVLYSIHRGYVGRDTATRRLGWLFGCAVALASLTFKPQGIAIVGFVVSAALARPFLQLSDPRSLANRLKVVLAIGVGIVVAVVLVFAAMVFDPSLIPNDWLRHMVDTQMYEYGRDGSIVWQRYETYVDPPAEAADFAAMVGLRFIYMFAIYARDYSMAHKVLNVVGLVPLYVLGLVGFWAILAGRATVSAQKTGALALSVIVISTLLHALTAIDYDWRYRVPLFCPLIVLAVIGWRTLRPPTQARNGDTR